MASVSPKSDAVEIRDVWDHNFESEFAMIRSVIGDFRYVSMDTEFPGIVCRPVARFFSSTDYNYATLKANADVLKLIQLGLTLFDERGYLPTCGTGRGCVWQFNFREFDPSRDLAASDSIELLRQSGINFAKNIEMGVEASRFAEFLMSSGVVLNDNVHWVTFHSGHDFGYLLKLLTGRKLPESQAEFFKLIRAFFPVVYDIKHLMKYCNGMHGGLSKLAELLGLERIGISHQAGSDSLLTARAYIKLKAMYFSGSPEKYAGVLYGLSAKH